MKLNSTNNGIYRPMNWLVMLITLVFFSGVGYSQVAINNDNSAPDASAMLDVKATGLGLLAPRMTFANRPTSPAVGLLIYQTNGDFGYYYYDGAAWQKVGRASDQFWMQNGGTIYYNAGRVAVGVDDAENNGLYVQNYVSGKAAVRGTDQSGLNIYAEGMLGVLSPGSLGIPISVVNIGVLGIKPNLGSHGAAVYGWNNQGSTTNYAGIFTSDGVSTYTNYGIYADARNSSTNYGLYADADSGSINYAGYFKGRVHVESNNESDGAGDYLSAVFTAEVTHNVSTDTRAIQGISVPAPGYGYGVYGEGGYKGVYGYANASTYSYAVGVHGVATGTTGTRIGIYGTASGGTTNWAGYFAGDCYISSDLRVGGTIAAAGYAVSVHGKIACEEVLIDNDAYWPDYVFAEDYELMSIDEFEESINENNHLPGMPSAQEVEENGGFHVGDIQKKTLEKVEELSLYIIELNNRLNNLEQENQKLKAKVINQ